MKNKLVLISLFMLMITLVVTANNISETKRKNWIDKAYKELKKFKPMDETPKPMLRTIGKNKQRYVIDDKGIVKFPDGSWIYIIIHSGHDDDEIGDVVMARDSEKNFYYCSTHVCGGLRITSGPGEEINSIEKLLSIEIEGRTCWVKFNKVSEVYPIPGDH